MVSVDCVNQHAVWFLSARGKAVLDNERSCINSPAVPVQSQDHMNREVVRHIVVLSWYHHDIDT